MGKAIKHQQHIGENDEWETPNELYEKYNRSYRFDIDVASNSFNYKCKRFYTKEINGLKQKWLGNIWCNPPYSLVEEFIKKGIKEQLIDNCDIAVFLTFAKTDVRWFHKYCYIDNNSLTIEKRLIPKDIHFIKGRVKFISPYKKKNNNSRHAPYPSMILIYEKERTKEKMANLDKYLEKGII